MNTNHNQYQETPTPIVQLDPDRLLTETQAADFLNVTRRALQNWRFTGRGPEYIRISLRCIRYSKADLLAWAEGHKQSNTSQNSSEG